MTSPKKFLGTFNEPPAPQPAVVVSPPAAPPPSPAPATVPVSAVIDLAAAIAQRDKAQQGLQQARATTDAPPPAPPPAAPAPDAELASVKKELRETNKRLADMQLENYRANAIANAKTAGQEMIDSLVGGRTPAEIDASIQYATAEYGLMKQRILQSQQSQPTTQALPPAAPPAAAPPVVTAPPVPQGSVSAAPPPAPAPQQQPSLPAYNAAPPVPDTGNAILSPEQLAYLTSPAAIRNGDYQKHRHVIRAAMQQGGGAPGPNWSLNNAPSLVPPQIAAPAAVPQQNIYSGVTQPSFQPAGPMPTHAMQPGMPTAAQSAGRPQQPVDLQDANGNSNGVSVDISSAREAANRAISLKRGTMSNPSNVHGQ